MEFSAQKQQGRAQEHNGDAQKLAHCHLLLQEEDADETAHHGHQQQGQLYLPDLVAFQVSVIEEIDPGLGKAAQEDQPPEAAQGQVRQGLHVPSKTGRKAEEQQHHEVVVIGDHVRVLMILFLGPLDDEGIGSDAGGGEKEEEIRDMDAHAAKVHSQHQQNAQEHHPGPQPVRQIELLFIEDHRDQVHHEHVGLQERRAGGEAAAGIAQIGKEVQQEAEDADHQQDLHRLALMEQA